MTATTPSAPDEVVLDEKALEAAHDAVRDALGYRHGNMVNLAGILVDFEVIAAAAIRAYLRASPQPAGVTEEQVQRVAVEYLLHRGEQPMRVTRGGSHLWQEHAPAIRAALEAASPTDTRGLSDDEERLVKLMEGTATAWEAATGPMVLQKPSSSARTLRKALALINRLKPTEAPVEDGHALLDLIREEASKNNAPFGRSDSLALSNIRVALGLSPHTGQPLAASTKKDSP